MIGVTGGKGGVGKSTFAILLLCELLKKNKKVLLCDCDVECPNDYLLLGEKLINSVQKIFGTFPKLDKRKCRKCGICAQTCRNNAIFINQESTLFLLKIYARDVEPARRLVLLVLLKKKKKRQEKFFLIK